MTKMKFALATLFLTICSVGFAQQQWDTFRGRITGGGGDRGKCVVEVAVDGTVEVEITAAEGRMRTLAGARGTWRNLECNIPMPGNPGDFKFNPTNGRGNQYLVRAPQDNRGVAIVRIEDEKGGSETYRFELEWRGGSGFGGGGFGNGNGGGFGNGGGIIDPPRGGGNLPFPNLPPGSGVSGWNQQVDFRDRGDGYYRSFRGSDEMLRELAVFINRGGSVQVELTTNRRDRIVLTGRLVYAERDRVVANMNGGEIQGTMEILLDSRNRVQELAMTGVGRNRFELRWQPR
jgi:hypothetical protein